MSGLDPFEEASAWWKANRDREDFTDYTLPEEERTREPATRVLAPPERDTWRGSRRFTFPNFVTVEVRSAAEASFTVEHLREGFFQAPVDRLTVRSSGGEFTISDIGMSDRGVKVNGREFRVPMTHLLVINETGGIDVIPLPEGEAPTGLIPMTTPR
ncbi:MAG: hypothetical protein HY608_02550 [Planctomycetes bacterium]|nr:hypothetical protein [Planctomycetota bacterium]